MPQSLTRLPENTRFKILGNGITIKNHKIEWTGDLIGEIMYIIESEDTDRNSLYQFEKYGISFEMAIEESVRGLEEDIRVLGYLVYWHLSIFDEIGRINDNCIDYTVMDFSKSVAGRNAAGQYIDAIRNCNDWGELYDLLRVTSKFQKNMEKKNLMEIREQQCRKV